MSRGGARRKDKLRRDLRLVAEHLRHNASPFKDCPHEDVGWTLSPKNLPAIHCRDCLLVATGGSVVLARQRAAAAGTQPPPPSKSPKGTTPSEASGSALPDQDPLTTQIMQQAAGKPPELEGLQQAVKQLLEHAQHTPLAPNSTLFGVPIVTSPSPPFPSAYKVKMALEAYSQGLLSKHQAESLLGLPISDKPDNLFASET